MKKYSSYSFVMFSSIMASLNIIFGGIYIQVLEDVLWAFKYEGEIIINFPPLYKWANTMNQSVLIGTIFAMYD